MEGIDLLQNLTEQRSRLIEAMKAQEEALNEKLFAFFKLINGYDGLEMMPLDCDIRRPWSLAEQNNLFEVLLTIRFFDESGAKWPNGQPKSDFGSDISLYIFDDHIKMNYGTCGDYTSKDKGQMSRAMLVCKLWENEDTICAIARALININYYDELEKVLTQINHINNNIKRAQRQREAEETLSKIRLAKFICKRRKQKINERWDEEKREYVNDGYEYFYHSFEKINKVTEKSVLTTDEYFNENHRRNLEEIISDIRGGYLFLQDEKIYKEPILPDEVPAK